ncbi:MAG: metal-dependent transcriptional regulator [Treponema sp.]|jgi:Mn-dependent DtxR family transcriptional regulator|nr:MAG: Transcriptional regulator MntR [Spirochaetes bacterium ADurb.Bin269]TAH53720.1 MAG: metal-dependent transcriptional regulator [Treponema sp.]HPX46564.1 metal-dependent transcriptional regulator [Treponemataceae bacterium]HQL31655.1 metal-dependent transcriptional regulator [Treponemataceae bacterium]
MPDALSASKQDYLETILDFTAESGQVRSIDIARSLGVSRASVNKSLGVLKETGLVEHEHYGDVKLTEKGLKAARAIRARHNAIKLFLSDVLGVSQETAEHDACRMEHTISKETAERLQEYLNKILPAKPDAPES